MEWMMTKATYDRSVGGTLSAMLNAIRLFVGLDTTTTPQIPYFPHQLNRPWEPKALPYKDEDKE